MFNEDKSEKSLLICSASKLLLNIILFFIFRPWLASEKLPTEITQSLFSIFISSATMFFLFWKSFVNWLIVTFLSFFPSIFSAFIILVNPSISSLIHRPFSVTIARYLLSPEYLFFNSNYINLKLEAKL